MNGMPRVWEECEIEEDEVNLEGVLWMRRSVLVGGRRIRMIVMRLSFCY